MERYRIVITDQAKYDILDIDYHISLRLSEPQTADRLISKIQEAIMSLEELPHRHEQLLGTRRFYVDNYTIFYEISNVSKIVYITSIEYSKRNWRSIVD